MSKKVSSWNQIWHTYRFWFLRSKQAVNVMVGLYWLGFNRFTSRIWYFLLKNTVFFFSMHRIFKIKIRVKVLESLMLDRWKNEAFDLILTSLVSLLCQKRLHFLWSWYTWQNCCERVRWYELKSGGNKVRHKHSSGCKPKAVFHSRNFFDYFKRTRVSSTFSTRSSIFTFTLPVCLCIFFC